MPSVVKSSAQDTVMDGSVTRRFRGMTMVMSLTRRVPPERTSLGSVTVALRGGQCLRRGGRGGEDSHSWIRPMELNGLGL